MAPKRKASKPATGGAKKKKMSDESPAASEPPSPATSKAAVAGSKFSVADAWTAPYVEEGVITQSGFSALCGRIEVEDMSFEACYLMYMLIPSVEDVMTVCKSKADLQRTVDQLGCRLLSDVPAKLRSKKDAMVKHHKFDMGEFQPFYRWMFDMGKSISAANTGAHVSAVRSVPVETGLQLMSVVLGNWELMDKLKEYCAAKVETPFSKDLWTQIGRFAHLTATGQIAADLSNYDDDGAGGGSAWPCMIDEFVEWIQVQQ